MSPTEIAYHRAVKPVTYPPRTLSRRLSIVGTKPFADERLRDALGMRTEHGAAEAYFSHMEGVERWGAGGLVEITVMACYGHTTLEGRLTPGAEGY